MNRNSEEGLPTMKKGNSVRTRALQCTLKVFLGLAIVLLITELILAFAWHVRRSSTFDEAEQKICEKCSALKIDDTLPLGCTEERNDNNVVSCCCKASSVIDRLVNKKCKKRGYLAQLQHLTDTLNRVPSSPSDESDIQKSTLYDDLKKRHQEADEKIRTKKNVKVPEHDTYQNTTRLAFDDFTVQSTAGVIKSSCKFRTRTQGKVSGIAYHRLQEETREKDLVYHDKSERSVLESVRYTSGRFYISNPGFYYISSQLNYAHDPESLNNTDARQSHALYRYSFKTGRMEKLMESTRTFAELNSSANNGTSFIGAVFELYENDEIMIKSTHTHKLSGGELENFFSLYVV